MQDTAKKQLERINAVLASGTITTDAFLSGRLGMAVYYYHVFKATGEQQFSDAAEKLLAAVFAHIDADRPGLIRSSLSNGGAGLGYTISFLSGEGFIDSDIGKELGELDRYLFDAACRKIDTGDTGYLHGAAGILHYFSE